jgi:choice-of-anchor A domain-containing protein
LLLVQGNATVDKGTGGVFNVGSVGVGSQIVPAGGSAMLAVGGDLTVVGSSSVHVGANVDGGGAVNVGGVASGTIETNGAPLTDALGSGAAMAPNAGFQTVLADTSAELATAATNGTTEVVGNRVTFTSTTADQLQVFTIEAAALSSTTEVFFSGIPAGAAIVVNVTGGPVAFAPTYFDLNGERVDDFASPNFGNAASRILWNITDATSLTLGGSSQFMGSVLAPDADAQVSSSTNGRLHVGGDLTVSGTGNEHHNYPWIGGAGLQCGDEPEGGFSASKVVEGDGASLVPAGTEFTLAYSYELDGASLNGTLTLLADGTVALGPQDLPIGTVVQFSETDLPVVENVSWGTPVISPATVTIAEGEPVHVVVTNTATDVTVAPTPTPEPTPTPIDPTPAPAPIDPVPSTPADAGSAGLASTGIEGVAPLLAVAAALLAAGFILTLVRRRRSA